MSSIAQLCNERANSGDRIDVKDLKLYQQLYIYFIPIFTNLGFINILVVVVRIWWFNKHLKKVGMYIYSTRYWEPFSVNTFKFSTLNLERTTKRR